MRTDRLNGQNIANDKKTVEASTKTEVLRKWKALVALRFWR